MISGGNEEGIRTAAVEVWCSKFLADYDRDKDTTGCPAYVEEKIKWAYLQVPDLLRRDKLDAFLKVWMGQPLEVCGGESGAEDSGYNATTSPVAARCIDEYKSGTRKIKLRNLSSADMPGQLKAFGDDGYIPWAVEMVKKGFTTVAACPAAVILADDTLVRRARVRLGPAVSMKFNGPHIPAVVYGLQLELPGLFWQSDSARWSVGARLMGGAITRLGDHVENDRTVELFKTGASVEWAFFRDSRVSISAAASGVMTFNGTEDLGGGGEFGFRVDPKNLPSVGMDLILEHIQGELLPCGGAYLYWAF